MKGKALSTVVLALLATSVVLAAPPDPPASAWFYDGFETYTLTEGIAPAKWTRLGNCAPSWGGMTNTEWGGQWGTGTEELSVAHLITGDGSDNTLYACDGDQYVKMFTHRGAYGGGGVPVGKAAQTKPLAPPSGIGWASQAAGNLQILHFKMRRQGFNMVNPWYHAGVYMLDDSNTCLMGWQGGSAVMRPQLNLPASSPTTVSPEGASNEFAFMGNNDCHVFDAIYNPATGAVDFYVDGTLKWSTTTSTGRASNSVYVRNFINTNDWHQGDAMMLDELSVGTSARSVVTAPVSGEFVNTTTPTVTWTHALPSGAAGYQVRVCSADNPAGPIVYDSGQLAPGATSKTTTALPTNQQLWAFVNEQYTGWTGWSLTGNGGFYVTTVPSMPPTVTSPSGTVVGAKPSVIFSGGVLHNQFKVKITTDPAGSVPVWPADPEATVFSSLKNGASCQAMLVPGTQYYAFARAGNAAGWSAWSAASAFQVTRIGEGVDFRGMDEKWGSQTVYDHDAAAPDDGFANEMSSSMNWINIKWQVLPDPFNRFADRNGVIPNGLNGAGEACDWWPSLCPGMLRDCPGEFFIPPNPPGWPSRNAPSYVYDLWDTEGALDDNSIKQHRIANLSLDNGVTFVTYARGLCYEGNGCGAFDWAARTVTEQAAIYICDDYGTGKCMASFRYGQSQAGICNDGATWALAGYTDVQQPDRPGQGWHTVRITGRNRIVGDPTTTEWNYYLDDDPTPLVSRTGVNAGSIDSSIAPGMMSGPIVDCIGIGLATGGMTGNWQWDWVAVNTSGNYAPLEEGPPPDCYLTISDMANSGHPGWGRLCGDTVITGVYKPDCAQAGFMVQDVNTEDHAGLYIPSTDTTNIVVGNKVTGISGVLTLQPGLGMAMAVPTYTATTDTAAAPPLAMAQRSVHGHGHTGLPGAQNGGMFVRICGRITRVVSISPSKKAVYIDDGAGLLDGRTTDGDPTKTGLRIVVDSCPSQTTTLNSYYRVDGISTCETWTEGAVTKTVETLLAPRFTLISEP